MSDTLQAAYDTFAKRIGRMLVRKGAEHCTDYYRLPTPAGVLIIQVRRNWLFCRFQDPLAGFILTHGLCHPDSGVWNSNVPHVAATLTDERIIHGIECEIDSFLTRSFSPAERVVAFAMGKHSRKLRDTFLTNFGRLQSVFMAASEAVASMPESHAEYQAICRELNAATEASEGSSSR